MTGVDALLDRVPLGAGTGPATVVCGGSVGGLSFARSLGRLGFDSAFMLQEIIPGEDDQIVSYLGLWDHGRELAWLTKRKLRQSPPGFGDGCCQRTERLDAVAKLSRDLLLALDYTGYVEVEFKQDPRDGGLKLMEVNARSSAANQIAISAGVDFPWLGYRYLVDGGLDESPEFREGVEFVHETWDVSSFAALHKAGKLTMLKWLRSYLGADARALGAWDDPWPLFATGTAACTRALRRAWWHQAA